MLTDRANAICLLEILKEYSDEQHILRMRDIISKMNNIYALKPDRRTVYSAVSLPINMGYDISIYEENGIGYYLRSRDIEPSEILILADAVYSFPFIPAKQSEKLIEKLQKHLSVHQRKKYKHLTIVRPDKKTDNRQVFWNIELLDEAINKRLRVEFTYLQYKPDKKLHPRREKPYVVNPYGMVYMNEHYYLICNSINHSNTSLYRIDRIYDIKLLETKWDKMPNEKAKPSDAVYAFIDEPERIVFNCEPWLLNDAIDKFGTSIQAFEKDENTLTISLSAAAAGVKFWALQYLPYMEIIEPMHLREEIIESIKNNKYGV